MDELKAKIEAYENKIADLKAYVADQDKDDVFGRISIVEANAEICDYEERIQRLQKRIAGEALCSVTDEQIAIAGYVNSPDYDND